MKHVILAAALVTLTFGCAQQETKQAAAGDAQSAYQAALSAAKAEQKKAGAVGGEWRDTGKIIKAAEKAAAEGEFSKAKKLADKAAEQGRLGQQQAASQANVGNPSYLY